MIAMTISLYSLRTKGFMDITLAFKAYPDTGRNVPSALVLSILNGCHFDDWTDFHTDSVTLLAFLTKLAR